MAMPPLSRRRFLQATAATASALAVRGLHASVSLPRRPPLREVAYSQVTVTSAPHLAQIENTRSILMAFSDDALMKPFRMMAGQPAPGENIGGWYEYKADYNYKTGDAGLAPGASFGQWTSALARMAAAPGDPARSAAMRDQVLRLNLLYADTISPAYAKLTRLPAYSFDKLVGGLKDAHLLLGDPHAFAILDRATDAVAPALPGHAVDRETPWLPGRDISWDWDESPTLPENLYLAYSLGAGPRYLAMANQYLDDATFFTPLAHHRDPFARKHGYSYVNAMGSAMQAWLVAGSAPHLQAALYGFQLLEAQSFATGGWGPDEILAGPGVDKLYESLTTSHNQFEAPCCAYAHMKLTRALLRVTRNGHYGDSMERVMYNTVLGALPLEQDGRAYYFQDYSPNAKRIYSVHRWPCCSGTLPMVAADYGINTWLAEPGGVWVNLYLPSILRWTETGAGSTLALEQSGGYPLTGDICFRLTASAATHFTLHLRIPGWAQSRAQFGEQSGAVSILVNGKPAPVRVEAGFASLTRLWSSGDRIDLTLPLPLRLEAIPGPPGHAHPQTVALVRGPLVLFPLGPGPRSFRERDLLAAQQTGPRTWTALSSSGPVELVPFTEVGEATYSTYMQLV